MGAEIQNHPKPDLNNQLFPIRLRMLSKFLAFNQYERDFWVATQAMAIPAGSRVLDIGAGSCPYRNFFAHCEYKTQDSVQLTSNQLIGQKGYGEIDFRSDILSIPVVDGSFDVILCTEVLEHVEEPIKALHEFARILRSGGRLLLTAPLGSGLHQEPFHFYGGYTPHWYRKFLKEAGFNHIIIEPNGGFFRHYGQESQRFSTMIDPRQLKGWLRLPLLFLWLITFPCFRLILPFLCYSLDRIDLYKAFTVGYFVTADRI